MFVSKLESWTGSNKARAREYKKLAIKKATNEGFIKPQPNCITFAGAKAVFEQKLVNSGITTDNNIVTIQRCKSEEDNKVYDLLRKVRDEKLPRMLIWPESFETFSTNYRRDGVTLPNLDTSCLSRSGGPRWYRKPSALKEMLKFNKMFPEPASVLDLDFCGTFNKKNAESVVNLFKFGPIADQGFLMLNFQKGREQKIEEVYDFISGFLRASDLYDFDNLVDSDQERLNLNQPDAYNNEILRIRLVPIYFICELYKLGYFTSVYRMIEYRDLNKLTGKGNIMRQWIFRFKRVEDSFLSRSRLKSIIEKTFNEVHEYPYLTYGL